MNRFQTERRSFLNKKALIQIVLFAAIAIWAIYGVSRVSGGSTAQEMANLESAVRRDMTLCYALEGFYPATVMYMQEHYGLTYDEDKYVINYEYTGSNLMPEVMIIAK